MPGTTAKLPTSKYKLIKEFLSFSAFTSEYHILCGHCKIYSKCSPSNFSEWNCDKCSRELQISETNHFTYIRLEEQLKCTLTENWDSIVRFKNEIDTINDNGYVKDIYDGDVMQKILQVENNVLSVTINTDGVSLKKSSKNSLWPLQIICNFLPPQLRYLLKNILTVGFYYNDQKPDVLKFFKPFVEELESLESNGFVFRHQVFRVAVTHAVFDLPAKAAFQHITQFNGYFGCGFCEERGEITDVGVRHSNANGTVELRTHESFVAAMERVMNTKNAETTVKGIKGICPAITFKYFDMVKSFCLDYMHNVLLGVIKNLCEFWLNPSKHHESLLTKDERALLNRRITSIRPCSFISRLPNSMDNRKKFKASEFRSLLLYYLPVCMDGILKKEYLDHMRLLSACIYKLLTTCISDQDLVTAEYHLKVFVKQYEELYGIENMTMNVHLLIHYVFCVKNLGPLCAQSMFSFESNNAVFSRYVSGSVNILTQINTKYILNKSIQIQEKNSHAAHELFDCFGFPQIIKLSDTDESTMTAKNIKFANKSAVPIYCIYKSSNDRFTSIHYTKAKKTIDYFVVMENSTFGKVKYYFEHENQNYAVIEEFEFARYVNHITEIKPKNVVLVCFAKEIKRKLIYINFSDKHFIVERPNPFESD